MFFRILTLTALLKFSPTNLTFEFPPNLVKISPSTKLASFTVGKASFINCSKDLFSLFFPSLIILSSNLIFAPVLISIGLSKVITILSSKTSTLSFAFNFSKLSEADFLNEIPAFKVSISFISKTLSSNFKVIFVLLLSRYTLLGTKSTVSPLSSPPTVTVTSLSFNLIL